MVYCAVVGCSSNNKKKSEGSLIPKFRFFRFPSSKEICKLWVKNCFQKNKFNTETARICSRHFTEDDYQLKEKLLNSPMDQWKLKKDVIPSLNLPVPTKEQTITQKIRDKRMETRTLIKNMRDMEQKYASDLPSSSSNMNMEIDSAELQLEIMADVRPLITNKDNPSLENEGFFKSHVIKVEDVEIIDQFIDDDGIHNKETYMIKTEYDNLEDLSGQIEGGEYSSFSKCEEILKKEDRDLNNCENSSEKVTADAPVMINCDLCKYASISRKNLRKHIRNIHTKIKQQKCPSCDYVTSRKGDLKLHIDSIHLNIKKHECSFCDYGTNHKDDLRAHLETHLNLKRNKCHFCDFSTNRKMDLKKHIDSVHLNLKIHKCHLCDYAANQKIHLKIHIDSIHLNLKIYKCHLCDYAANRNHGLQKHIDSCHFKLKEHKCDFCEFTSSEKHGLESHVKSVHLNLKEHKCDLCNYAANRKSHLKLHVDAVHLNLKQHKCALCDYAANHKHYLKVHVDHVHLNLKKHKCNLCKYAASRKSLLVKHLYSVHSYS